MIIRYVDIDSLNVALRATNTYYRGNIQWKRLERVGAGRFMVTLRCHSATGPGHRLGFTTPPRPLAAACWHVYGAFIDALPTYSVIQALGRKLRPLDPWRDWQVGQGRWASEMCECDK